MCLGQMLGFRVTVTIGYRKTQKQNAWVISRYAKDFGNYPKGSRESSVNIEQGSHIVICVRRALLMQGRESFGDRSEFKS